MDYRRAPPTSPHLCNSILYNLDYRISEFSKQLNLVYTRYADDILISGAQCSLDSFEKIVHFVRDAGFLVNEKSSLMRDPKKLVTCGISIASGQMKLPRASKRQIRRDAHFMLAKGILAESRRGEMTDPFAYDRIMGKLAFWSMIEPNAKFPSLYRKTLRERYRLDLEAVSS